MVDYPKFINELFVEHTKSKVIYIDETKGDDNIRHRFRIEYKLNFNTDPDTPLVVIMMNPSMANKDMSDITVNKILMYANCNKYSKVIILNSLPMYESASENLNNFKIDIELLEKNKNKIKSCLEANVSSPIVIHTGRPTTRAGAESVAYIYDIVRDGYMTFTFPKKNKKEPRFDITGYVRHLSRSSKLDDLGALIPLNLNDYQITV